MDQIPNLFVSLIVIRRNDSPSGTRNDSILARKSTARLDVRHAKKCMDDKPNTYSLRNTPVDPDAENFQRQNIERLRNHKGKRIVDARLAETMAYFHSRAQP